jgi:hypothetical protein
LNEGKTMIQSSLVDIKLFILLILLLFLPLYIPLSLFALWIIHTRLCLFLGLLPPLATHIWLARLLAITLLHLFHLFSLRTGPIRRLTVAGTIVTATISHALFPSLGLAAVDHLAMIRRLGIFFHDDKRLLLFPLVPP